jgi:hypothetical protein
MASLSLQEPLPRHARAFETSVPCRPWLFTVAENNRAQGRFLEAGKFMATQDSPHLPRSSTRSGERVPRCGLFQRLNVSVTSYR